VIGARDPYRGETVKAVVVLKKDMHVKAEEIIDWAREKMAAFKVPRVVQFVEQLPKTATGKILWRQLQEEENRRRKA
jgi:fatty-acyl-CoA synthase